MACVVCQHCQGQVFKADGIAIRDGYSYHKKCHKCYVCSETDLRNAEVFKGVIFCSSCSQRIFQGCSAARDNKNGNRSRSARAKTNRREKRHHKERRVESARPRRALHTNGVLELAQLAVSSGSSNSVKNRSIQSNPLAFSTELAMQVGKQIYDDNSFNIKKESIEMGMTTDVTQELLKQMNCPVVTERKHGSMCPSPRTCLKDIGDHQSQCYKSIICSDLRIAELGASTEIAHMALRKRSELPVIINSGSGKPIDSSSLSEESGDVNKEWVESTYASKQEKKRWLDRRIRSILKIPYKSFKKNILNRSSFISFVMHEQESRCVLKKIKMLFNEEVVEHKRRGVKRLYSTINRRKTPYKLGWLNLMAKVSTATKPKLAINDKIHTPSERCKHFDTSPSYRCMRDQVMRLAGPTKSELAVFRNKMKNIITPTIIKDILGFYNKNPAIMMTQACGSDVHRSSSQRLK